MASINTIEKYLADNAIASGNPLPEDSAKKNAEGIAYIKQLASLTGTPLVRWQIDKLFIDPTTNNIYADKILLNRHFFAKLNKIATNTDNDHEDAPDIEGLKEALGVLDRATQASINARVGAMKREATSIERYAAEKYVEAQASWGRATKMYEDIRRFEGGSVCSDIKRDLQDVLRDGVWVNPKIVGSNLFLTTAANIGISYINRAAGIDIRLDLGKLAVKIEMENFGMCVIPYEDNLYASPYPGSVAKFYHPHVNDTGGICWGSALETYRTNAKTFKLADNLKLLHALLSSYSDSNPYMSIQSFRDTGIRIESPISAAIRENLLHPSLVAQRNTSTAEFVEVNIQVTAASNNF